MKISDLEITMVKSYLRVDSTDDDLLIQLIIDSAKSYLKAYTGLDDAKLDTKQDLTLGVLALVTDMYENRSYTVEQDKVNKVIDSMLSLHSINLL